MISDDDSRAELRTIRSIAMGILARREHSEQELRRKLSLKFSDSLLIEHVITGLSEDKLLSNRRFAESYTRHRSRAGFGPRRIALELAERGVNDTVIREGMADAQRDWYALARREFCKKYGSLEITEIKMRAKVNQFLFYRGFSTEHIEYALAEGAES